MYTTILTIHSLLRWLVLLSIVVAIYRAYRGYFHSGFFTKLDNSIRHWTATLAHLQLIFGLILYFQSPVTSYFWSNLDKSSENADPTFFGLIHLILMVLSIVVLTIGSAMAKRKREDAEKFKIILTYYTAALLIIFIAIPWPFSPFATRPYFRTF